MPTLLTPADVARWLTLPTPKVERLARRGEIPAIVLPDGNLVFSGDELSRWLEGLRGQQREATHA